MIRGDAGGMDTGLIKKSIPDFKDIKDICSKKELPLVIPVYIVLDDTLPRPADAFERLREGEGFILESLEGNEKTARYSILGFNTRARIRIGEKTEITGDESLLGSQTAEETGDPIEAAKAAMKNSGFLDTGIPRFPGGFAGYFSYDLIYS